MADRNSSGDVEEVRARTDIVDLISQYVPLKRAGSTFKACCPFHKEKTPSFTVNAQKQIYHCFGCGAGGDVFSFLMQHEGMDFRGALEMLAERAGVTLQKQRNDKHSSEKKELYELHSSVAAFFRRCLGEMQSAETARKYLQTRNLDGKIAEQFVIGYAPARWDAMLQWGEKSGYTPEQLEAAGLIIRSERADARNPYYDRFRNRIMFPIRDEQGRTIGFSGRALAEGDRTAKYVNSPETLLFHKSRVLYALDQARKAIIDSGEALICEGQIDVIRCHQCGFNNAVAAQGTAFTETHAAILKRYADNITLIFDSDRAGRAAAVRTGHVFLATGMAVKAVSLPPKSDPDSFLQEEGPDAFRQLLEKAVSIVKFNFNMLEENEDSESEIGAMRIARALAETISVTPNAVQRSRMIQEAAELLNVPESAIAEQLRQSNRRSRPSQTESGKLQNKPSNRPIPADESALCEYIVNIENVPEIADDIEKCLPFSIISNSECRIIAQAAWMAFKQQRPLNELLREVCHENTDDDIISQTAAKLQMAPQKHAGDIPARDAFRAIMLRLWQKTLKAKRQQLISQGRENHSAAIRQLTLDLKFLHNWQDGEMVIHDHLAEFALNE